MNFFMKFVKNILVLSLALIILNSCSFIFNDDQYKKTTQDFVNNIIDENYQKSFDYLVIDRLTDEYKDTNSLKSALSYFRTQLTDGFGTKLEYKFLKAEKKISTIPSENTPKGTTQVLIEFKNKEYFGVFKILFDDASQKILEITILDIKERIPSMTIFWLVGLIAILVPVFNIYVIYKVKKSSLKKKWIKYIAIIFLNIPTISYFAANGFSFNLSQIQLFFGFGFSVMGYMYSFWSIGVPLGGLYWFWRLSVRKQKEDPDLDLLSENNI